MNSGLLVTADGAVFRGSSVAADGLATGELVFNTAMAGYQEIVTDPSYTGQVVALTAPHIGNYGTNHADEQSAGPRISGLVTRAMSPMASSWRSEGDFAGYLKEHGVVVLSDVDTRRLTRHVRSRGAMPVAIGSEIDEAELLDMAATAPSMAGQNLVDGITTRVPYVVSPTVPAVGRIVAYDFGIKKDIVTSIVRRGWEVSVVPASTSAEEALGMDPHGVVLSNGPGDPEPLTHVVATVTQLLGKLPVFGICLGHQILGLALGAKTFKLPFGHHGGNHPVRQMSDGAVLITSQNHGFAVDLGGLGGGDTEGSAIGDFGRIEPTHVNLNDGTLEGFACRDLAARGIQFHPEAAPGPDDAQTLFDDFVEEIGVTAEVGG